MPTRCIPSPLGPLSLTVDGQGRLVRLAFEDAPPDQSQSPALDRIEEQLREYFAGERRVFDVELAPAGTDFQRRVWDALVGIGWGETATYGGLARALGQPGAARAVGLANARNPIAIVVPCHRVVGEDGTLTGYAGGLDKKRWLLAHEGSLREPLSLFGR